MQRLSLHNNKNLILKKEIMKKILALSLAFAAFTLSVSAQQTSQSSADTKVKHERKHGDHKNGMMKDLNLSDAQKTQMKTIREDKTLSKDARKEKMNGVFTADQKTKMAQGKVAIQAKRKEMGEKRAQEMKTKLGLSNDQSAKLKSQNDATHAQMKAIKEDNSLTKEAKKEKMKSVKASAKEQRKSVMTADQLKKMDEMKKEHKGKHKKMNK